MTEEESVEAGKRGPTGPSKPLTDKEFKILIGMIQVQCTREEICAVFGMSHDTLCRRVQERGFKNFEALKMENSAKGRASLRRLQWKSAEKGNIQMQIWLGKQYLEQFDATRSELSGRDGAPIAVMSTISVGDLSDAALAELAAARGASLGAGGEESDV